MEKHIEHIVIKNGKQEPAIPDSKVIGGKTLINPKVVRGYNGDDFAQAQYIIQITWEVVK